MIVEKERSGVRLVSRNLTDGSPVYSIYLHTRETQIWALVAEPVTEDAALQAFDLFVDGMHAGQGMLEVARGVDHLAEQGLRS